MNITTDRCAIRAFIEKDLDTFISYRNNDEWMIYQDFKGHTKDEYRDMIIVDKVDIFEGVQLAITQKMTDELLGDLYVKANKNTVHLGYTIHPVHARQGYIYEAIIGIIPYLRNKGITQMIASAHNENIASLNLLSKIGFDYIGIADNGDKEFRLDLGRYAYEAK